MLRFSKFIFFVFVSSFFLFNLTGCMSFGKQFPSETGWIVKKQTSQEDIIMLLGEPYSVGKSGETPVWTYLFSEYKVTKPFYQKELKIYWDSGKLVKHYQFTSSFPEDLKRNLPKKSKAL